MSRTAPVQCLIGNGEHANSLYVMHVSIHGRFRALDPELGVDADTGGQTKYVLELTKRLGVCTSIRRIDLLTRKITDPRLVPDYARDIEVINDGARIVRLPCGPAKYIPKERLWPHLEEIVDNALDYIQKQGDVPDVIHGHYADGGFVATRIAKVLGIPLIFTAHSLGRFKRERLVSDGMPARQAERQFHFRERIEAEEETLENADAVIASTGNEVDTQYRLYDHYDKAAKGLAVRYLSWRLNVSIASFLTAGDAGNDIDMLKGSPRGIVVANYSREVGAPRRSKDVYFPHSPTPPAFSTG